MRQPKHVKLKCGHCRKMFVPTIAQLKRSKWPSTLAIRPDGFMCSMVCSGLNASCKRFEKTGRKMGEFETAHYLVMRATKSGKLKKPEVCEKCGTNPGFNSRGRSKLHAHHEDHAKPLDVEWLCFACHAAISPRKRGEDNNKAKLTEALVRKIRYGILKDISSTFVGAKLGISRITVQDIRRGKTWRHVKCS